MANRSRSPLVRKLLPLAVELLKAYRGGVTMDDLHTLAIIRGLLTGTETHRELSCLGHVFRAAGGVNSGNALPATMPSKKGARQTVWTYPYKG